MNCLTLNWYNSDGFYSVSFNADYMRIDPMGYLHALCKNGEMLDLHVLDGSGRDVTERYL